MVRYASGRTRARLFLKAAEIVKRRRSEIADALARETGSTIYAVRTATFGCFFHQGEICLNTHHILIQRRIYDEFMTRFVERIRTITTGDPQDPNTIIGPLVTPAAVELVDERVREAVAKGAFVRTGGRYTSSILSGDTYRAFELAPRIQCGSSLAPNVATLTSQGVALQI